MANLNQITDPVYIAEKGQPSGAATLGVDGILTLAQRATYTTTIVAEGTNLYYTNARVQAFGDSRYALQSTTILASGGGILGGGDLSANRTISLDISYLDDRYASGYKQKSPVRAATTANITLSAPQTVDGVAVIAGDRVLVKNQTLGQENGIYVVAAGAWTRSTDFDTAGPGEVEQGAAIFVQEGTTNNKTGWSLSTPSPIVVGTTPLMFIQYAGANSYSAGTGLQLIGNTFSALTTTALWNAVQLRGVPISAVAPLSGQLIMYNGTDWASFTPTYISGNQTITLSGDVTGSGTTAIVCTVPASVVRTKLSAGTGISYSSGTGVITNASPDQVVVLNSGTGISATGTYPTFTITNIDPDQTVVLTNGTGISVTGTYPNFTITNTGVITTPNLQAVTTAGNTATNSITLGAAANTTQYGYEIKRRIGVVDYTTSRKIVNPSGSFASDEWRITNGTAAQDKFIRLDHGNDFPVYSFNNGSTENAMWHAGNHIAGSLFTPTLTGALVPASFTSNASGHVTAFTTRTLTPADIGAVATGSNAYITNQIASAQSANFWISAIGRTSGSFQVASDGLNTIKNQITLLNVAQTRGANIQLTGDATPGLAMWVHNGASYVNRFQLDFDGSATLTGNLDATGYIQATTELRAPILDSNASAGSLAIIGGSVTVFRGAQIGLYGGTHATTPGIMTFHSGLTGAGAAQPERMRIDAVGGVGIGTSSIVSGYKLQVAGLFKVSNTNTHFNFGELNSSTVFMQAFNTVGSVGKDIAFLALSENMRIQAGGNVGIGITTPQNRVDVRGGDLDVRGPSSITAGGVRLSPGTGGGYIYGETHNGTSWITGALNVEATDTSFSGTITGNTLQSHVGDSLVLYAQSANIVFAAGTSTIDMTLDTDGRLGIGVTPNSVRSSLLEVNGNIWSVDAYILGVGNTPRAEFGMDGASFVRTMVTGTAGALSIRTNDVEQVKFNVGGQVDFVTSVKLPIRIVAVSTALTINDHTIIANANSIVLTLPSGGAEIGRVYRLVNNNRTGVTISPTILLNGVAVSAFPANAKYTVQSDGTNWYVIGD